jgi:hypothetical protein
VTLEVRVVHAAVDKNIRNRVTHDFADPQLTLRAAGGGIFAVVAWHCRFLEILKPALVAGIQVVLVESGETWTAGTSARTRASRFCPATTPFFSYQSSAL